MSGFAKTAPAILHLAKSTSSWENCFASVGLEWDTSSASVFVDCHHHMPYFPFSASCWRKIGTCPGCLG